MPKEIFFEGKVHTFPDDFTDDEIAAALSSDTPSTPKSVGGFMSNLASSAGQFVGDTVSGLANVLNPDLQQNTLANLGRLGLGAAQKVIPGEQAHEKYADAVGQHFADRYGGLSNIGETLYNDPVGALSDAAAVVTGGAGLVAQGAKLGKMANVASTAQKVGTVAAQFDPLAFALSRAKMGPLAKATTPEAQAAMDYVGAHPELGMQPMQFADNPLARGMNQLATGTDRFSVLGRHVSNKADEAAQQALPNLKHDFGRHLEDALAASRGAAKAKSDYLYDQAHITPKRIEVTQLEPATQPAGLPRADANFIEQQGQIGAAVHAVPDRLLRPMSNELVNAQEMGVQSLLAPTSVMNPPTPVTKVIEKGGTISTTPLKQFAAEILSGPLGEIAPAVTGDGKKMIALLKRVEKLPDTLSDAALKKYRTVLGAEMKRQRGLFGDDYGRLSKQLYALESDALINSADETGQLLERLTADTNFKNMKRVQESKVVQDVLKAPAEQRIDLINPQRRGGVTRRQKVEDALEFGRNQQTDSTLNTLQHERAGLEKVMEWIKTHDKANNVPAWVNLGQILGTGAMSIPGMMIAEMMAGGVSKAARSPRVNRFATRAHDASMSPKKALALSLVSRTAQQALNEN